MKVILFDFEVFKEDWMVVFKELGVDGTTVIINDAEELEQFFENNKENIFTGYNNKFYDNHILRAILSGICPYEVTKKLIEERVSGYQIKGLKRIKFATIDLMDEIISMPSLKAIEGNLGMNIEESTVPFDIDRKLTTEELREVIDYCIHDVRAAEMLFNERYESYIKPKMMLISKFGMSIDNINKTFAGLTATILNARKRQRFDELVYEPPSHLDIANKEILNLYQTPIDYKKKLKTDIGGIEHTLGYGGLHGALQNYHKVGGLLMIDVASYYPSMMIEYGYHSRNLLDPGKYKEIYDDRLLMKQKGDPMNVPYKIMLNATYGAMKNKYNELYDPRMPNQICITGQLMLVELIEKLQPYSTLVQSNTDGILVEIGDLEAIRGVTKEWQERTKMVLEEEFIELIYQKDVNNYIYVTDRGKIKVKGSYVNKWQGGSFEQNSMVVVHRAVVENLLRGVPVRDTIHSCENMMDFQMICNRTGKFKKTVLTNPDVEINKVNRVFASREKNGRGIYKIKEDGSYHKFPNSPENVIIYNGHMSECPISKKEIDMEWYCEMAQRRVDEFKGSEEFEIR